MMAKFLARFVLLLLLEIAQSSNITAQTSIETDSLLVNIAIGGILDSPFVTSRQNQIYIHSVGPWFTAKNSEGKDQIAISLNRQQNDFWAGPLDTTIAKALDPNDWQLTWKITQSAILNHQKKFNQPDYKMPQEIIDWPAKSFNGSDLLAGFVDIDENGIYEPQKGDYPYAYGDVCLLTIFNDEFGEHKASGGVPLDIEIHQYAYIYNELPSVIFLKYIVFNRKNENLNDFKMGLFTNWHLGNPYDNFFQSDVKNHYCFAFQGDSFDEGQFGFGLNKPIAGLLHLDQNLKGTILLDDDHEKTPLLGNTTALLNAFNTKWANGTELSFAPYGRNGQIALNHIYSGTTDELLKGENWTEYNDGNLPGHRVSLSISSEKQLKSKSNISFNWAYFVGQGDINDLNKNIEKVFTKYKEQLASIHNEVKSNNTLVFPNPLVKSDNKFLELKSQKGKINTLKIYGSNGQLVYSHKINDKNLKLSCNIFEQTGVYIIEAELKDEIYVKKLIVL